MIDTFDQDLLEDGYVGIKVKEGESVHIDGDAVEVFVRRSGGVGAGVVQLLVRAPRCISVRRGNPTQAIRDRETHGD